MLQRYAAAVAICAFISVVSGALLTGSDILTSTGAASVSATIPISSSAHDFFVKLHITAAMVLLAGNLLFAIWATKVGRSPVNWLAWSVFFLALIDVAIGESAQLKLSSWQSVLHALVAHCYFAGTVAIAILVRKVERSLDAATLERSKSWLRPVAALTPALVLLQILLGAAYRHGVLNILWHMGGAMAASLLLVVICIVLIQSFPKKRPLHSAGVIGLVVVLMQVALGIGAFLLRLLDMQDSYAWLVDSSSHVSNGTLTLAISVVLAIQVRRLLTPAGV